MRVFRFFIEINTFIAENYFLSDPEFNSKVPSEYLSHKEKYEEAIRNTCILLRKMQHLQNEGKLDMGQQTFR